MIDADLLAAGRKRPWEWRMAGVVKVRGPAAYRLRRRQAELRWRRELQDFDAEVSRVEAEGHSSPDWVLLLRRRTIAIRHRTFCQGCPVNTSTVRLT